MTFRNLKGTLANEREIIVDEQNRSVYSMTTDLKALDQFNTELATNDRIDAWLMPLFDGVALGRLLD